MGVVGVQNNIAHSQIAVQTAGYTSFLIFVDGHIKEGDVSKDIWHGETEIETVLVHGKNALLQ